MHPLLRNKIHGGVSSDCSLFDLSGDMKLKMEGY